MIRYPRVILATCCVPWTEKDAFAERIFRQSVRLQIEAGFRHLYVFGTAGEGYAVSEAQFDAVVRSFVDETRRGGVNPMVGLISLSLRTVIERIERCRMLGVEEFQISLPSWGALSGGEVTRFFAETCGRFPEARFLHYNLARAGRLVSPEEYAVLAEQFPNLVATKHGGADLATTLGLLERAGALRHFFTELGYGYATLLGEPGFLVSVASINPALARAYFEAGQRRDADAIAAFARDLGGIIAELHAAVGDEAHMDGAFDKIFCRLRQPEFPVRLLPPYAGASEAAVRRFAAALRAQHPRWLDDLNHDQGDAP